MDTATAGSASVWINSAAVGSQLIQRANFGLTGTNNSNIQIVINFGFADLREKVRADAKKIIIPSSPGGSVSIGQTVFVGQMQ
ncbi:hypothetical protein NB231_03285 [Nitrococcus mobilis Nb-231]|uniref:Uncharacterized protein n=2 Tax=Nitrococcus mobilis TaxID=35797 RepID=A4BR98_9GAMM|nr:hypothetical protein NB231_03285 [Nitrococcus mobilis Nb-231]